MVPLVRGSTKEASLGIGNGVQECLISLMCSWRHRSLTLEHLHGKRDTGVLCSLKMQEEQWGGDINRSQCNATQGISYPSPWSVSSDN